jgi:hypothetical protein
MVCGRVFDTQRYLTEISKDLGLGRVDKSIDAGIEN